MTEHVLWDSQPHYLRSLGRANTLALSGMTQCDSVYLLLKHLRMLHVVFLFFAAGFLQRCVCFCLGTVCPCLLALSVRFSLCPFLFFSLVFLFCSACPSRASRLICLCFRLNERSVEAGWRINSRICNKQSQLALPLMLSLRLVLFLPRSTPQEGEKRDELLFTGLFLSVE